MVQKYFSGIIPVVFVVITLGCMSQPNSKNISRNENGLITKSFGSYIIPAGWIEVPQWTRGKKYFYANEGSRFLKLATNISIEMGTNRYALNDHMTFRYVILRQLSAQAGNGHVYDSGTITDNGDPLYIFTVEDENEIPRVKTVQYYIVGEKRHVLIHLTDYYNENVKNAEEIALGIANSFSWADRTGNPSALPMWITEMWRAEAEDYLLSKHDTNNNLIYFFIKKDNTENNAYAFIITDQMEEFDSTQCLAIYLRAGDIPGFRTTEDSADWYNQYSPVVIQDDYRGISLAAFSLPKNIKKIWIFVQNVTLDENRANIQSLSLTDFELGEGSTQYYLIDADAGEVNDAINSVDRTAFDKLLNRATIYATQAGTKFQSGYIAGKGQEPQLME
jgi:hypothetical protein